jgi:hypothetical protein
MPTGHPKRAPLDPAEVTFDEAAVAIPSHNATRKRYTFIEAMRPGDSCTVPFDRAQVTRAALTRYQAATKGARFVTRTVAGDRIRIWRIK